MAPRLLADLRPLDWSPWRRRLLLLLLPPAVAGAALAAVLVFGPPALGPAAATGAPARDGAPATQPPAPDVAAAGDPAAADGALPAPAGLLVEVSGAVARPGMYRVAKGERASAAIAAAGGLAPDADPDRLPNMAARLRDGQQVVVPRLGRAARTAAGSGQRSVATVSLNSAMNNMGRIIGPALAGLTISAFGIGPCFFLNAASFGAVSARAAPFFRVIRAACKMISATLTCNRRPAMTTRPRRIGSS